MKTMDPLPDGLKFLDRMIESFEGDEDGITDNDLLLWDLYELRNKLSPLDAAETGSDTKTDCGGK